MPVLHAGILFAAVAAAALPVIIHLLFRRRRQPVPWGAMRFVLEAHRKTRRRTNLERWLLLACRCLLVLAVGVALARPLLNPAAPTAQGGRTVWLVLDDGLCGQTAAGPGAPTDLRTAAQRASALLGTLGPGDRAAVVLAGAPARPLVLPPSGNLAGVRSAIDAVTATDAPGDYAGAIALLAEAISADRAARPSANTSADWAVLPQTLRLGAARLDAPLPALPSGVRLLTTSPDQEPPTLNNVGIASARALRSVVLGGLGGADTVQTVTVQLLRSGVNLPAAATRLSATLGPTESAAAAGEARWSAGQREATVTLVVSGPAGDQPGAPLVTVKATDPDAIGGDDTFRLPIVWRDLLRIGILADADTRGGSVLGGSLGSASADRLRPGQWAALALRPSDSTPVELIDVEPAAVDAARLAGLDALLVLSPDALGPAGSGGAWTAIRRYLDEGGLVILTPPADPARGQWAAAAATGLGVQLAVASAPRSYPQDAPAQLADTATPPPSGDDLLTAVRGELAELTRPVNFSRLLPPDVPPDADSIVLLRAGDGALVLTLLARQQATPTAQGGAVVYLAAALDLSWTDLPTKPLMVPLMQELVRQGVGRARPVFAATAGQRPRAPQGAAELRPLPPASPGLTTVMLSPDGSAAEPVRHAGTWQAVDAAGADRGVVAVNAPAAAADPSPVPRASVIAWLKAAAPSAQQTESPVSMLEAGQWSSGLSAATGNAQQARTGTGSMLLLGALGLALLEVLLARRAALPHTASAGARP